MKYGLESLREVCIFASVKANSEYLQIVFDGQDKDKTTLASPQALYQFL